MYATKENGEYTVIASTGWSVEEAVTKQALHELKRLTLDAHSLVKQEKRSPLYFHMYHRRMDIPTLAGACALFQWRVKRHFRPEIFNNLSQAMLARYGDALGISVSELCSVPACYPVENE